MKTRKKIRVLVVDDSMLFRKVLVDELSRDVAIEIVGVAGDPFEARDKILELDPDVMTLDVQMPKMNGIDFLKKLMPVHPLPVVVVSSVSEAVFDALTAGAVDFVAKPTEKHPGALHGMMSELLVKIKVASMSKLSSKRKRSSSGDVQAAPGKHSAVDVIAIGASTGGTEAIFEVIRKFPRTIPPTVIVQHMPPVFTRMYADRMNASCQVHVKEAEPGDVLKQGHVYIAPGEQHMTVIKKGAKWSLALADSAKVSGHRPSVDVLFQSVAQQTKGRSIGVLLTGMGRDGANGLLKMRSSGSSTVGQDESSSVVYGMPKVAYEIGAVERQLKLPDIAAYVLKLLDLA